MVEDRLRAELLLERRQSEAQADAQLLHGNGLSTADLIEYMESGMRSVNSKEDAFPMCSAPNYSTSFIQFSEQLNNIIEIRNTKNN